MVVLTTPWPAAEAAIRSMGDVTGKVILDATNPLAMGPDGLGLEIGHSISAGEKVQGWAKGAFVFKTLNIDRLRQHGRAGVPRRQIGDVRCRR